MLGQCALFSVRSPGAPALDGADASRFLRRCADMRQRFGARVAEIIAAGTDACSGPEPPWMKRKPVCIDGRAHHKPESLLLSRAAKRRNARAIMADDRNVSEAIRNRFKAAR